MQRLGLDRHAESLERKSAVLYPAQAALPLSKISAKWSGDQFTIVFCGRDYVVKQGEMALRVMSRLSRDYPFVRCIYVGKTPRIAHDVRGGVEVYSELARHEVLSLFADAHVLFHPSRFEGLGTVFLEAGAAGLAVVAATGQDMAHSVEIFDQSGALLVDRDLVSEGEEEHAFEERLRILIQQPDRAQTLGLYNWRRCDVGKFSLAARDAVLASAYARCTSARSEALSRDALQVVSGASTRIVAVSTNNVRLDLERYKDNLGLHDSYALLKGPQSVASA